MAIHSIYGPIIKEAFTKTQVKGMTDRDINDIEDVMRHDIFHSTLDWQSRDQLKDAALTAWDIVRVVRRVMAKEVAS